MQVDRVRMKAEPPIPRTLIPGRGPVLSLVAAGARARRLSAMSFSMPADAEWLLTDGQGGYACGAADDRARRRYHAAWIARATATAQRYCLVAGFDEQLAVGGEVVSLLHARWSGLVEPMRPPVDVTFARWPEPTYTFRHGAFTLARSLRLRGGFDGGGSRGDASPTLLVRWHNRGDGPIRLVVRPLLGWCNANHLVRSGAPRSAKALEFDATVHARGASWGFRPDDSLPPLWLTAAGVAAFTSQPDWYRGFEYDIDRERGYDHVGDRWTPGKLELDIPVGASATVAFRLGEPCADPLAEWTADERAGGVRMTRARAFASGSLAGAVDPAAADAAAADPGYLDPGHLDPGYLDPGNGVTARLAAAADDFFYEGPGGRLGVLAGFPWFGEWGRDVFLALPGLALARGRVDLMERVLSEALPFLQHGLLPNIYAATVAASDYGSCDAALWYALAVQRYADAETADDELLQRDYVPALVQIAEAYLAGTDLGLHVETNGLLAAGGPDLNATWMDAQTSAGPVTPRAGYPIEIQALWYALLAFLVERDVEGAGRYREVMTACGEILRDRFWLAEDRYLADRLLADGSGGAGAADPAVRPNMLMAAALARSPLTAEQRAGVVQKARAELLTPCGLRTLSPRDAEYRGRYRGGIETRDAAYHQGTVWPWPGGFYVEAALQAAAPGERADVVAELSRWLDGFATELDRAGLEHVSEVFDGDAPHRPGGTFAQAWNTGELLRAFALVRSAAAEAAEPKARAGRKARGPARGTT